MISTNQTGQFPNTSGQGHTQIMVLYDNDTNVINVTAIKSKHKEDLIEGYNKLYNDTKKAGITPVIQIFDNETSQELFEAIEEKQLQYQLAPPGNHQTLPAEQEIQTFKNNFILILYGVDDSYPANQWD